MLLFLPPHSSMATRYVIFLLLLLFFFLSTSQPQASTVLALGGILFLREIQVATENELENITRTYKNKTRCQLNFCNHPDEYFKTHLRRHT